jgi:hypothetical protein
VVACGRFTACYTLLVHLTKRYGDEFAQADEGTRQRGQQLRELWTSLQKQALLDSTQPLAED